MSLFLRFFLCLGHGFGHGSSQTPSIHCVPKMSWGKVGIPERRLNITMPEDLPSIAIDLYDKQGTVGRMKTAAHMAKSDRINIRIDGGLKKRAVKIFDRLGLTEAEAIRLFYAQVELHQGLPFPVTMPNATTMAAMDETDKPEKLPSFKTFRALRNHMGV